MPALDTCPLLVIDSGSPLLSVAVGRPDGLLASRESTASRSSAVLMELVDGCLTDAQVDSRSLAGVLALSGPGSFTGLRVGMSIALGLHQALGIPAGAMSTFLALAGCAPPDPTRSLTAVVPALRSTWYSHAARLPPQLIGEPQQLDDERLLESTATQIVGFGLESLAERFPEAARVDCIRPTGLAVTALHLAEDADWRADTLASPAYLAPPPVHSRH